MNDNLIKRLAQEAEAVRKSAERLSLIADRDPDHSRSLQRASRALIAASGYISMLHEHIRTRETSERRGPRKVA